jgi:hypothetical protein
MGVSGSIYRQLSAPFGPILLGLFCASLAHGTTICEASLEVRKSSPVMAAATQIGISPLKRIHHILGAYLEPAAGKMYIGLDEEVVAKSRPATDGRQRRENWCWAACSQMVMNYHGLEQTQEDLAR